jgi:hypothetical protein
MAPAVLGTPRDPDHEGMSFMATTSIRTPFTEVPEDTREGRGLALYLDRGSEFVRVSRDTFLVPSRSKRGVEYFVDLAAESCECFDHKRNGGPCLHAYAAMLHQAWLRRAARTIAPLFDADADEDL